MSSGDRFSFLIPGFLTLLTLGGAVAFHVGGRLADARAEARSAWPSVMGTVVGDGSGAITRIRYVVDGEAYEGATAQYREVVRREGRAEADPNAPVRVYYNPEHPSELALDLRRDDPGWLFTFFSVLMAVLSLPFAYLTARVARRARR